MLDSRAQTESRETAMMAHLQESIFNEGGTNYSRLSLFFLSLSLAHALSLSLSLFLSPLWACCASLSLSISPPVGLLWAHKIFQKIPEDSREIPAISALEECGTGPMTTRVALVCWCYASLLRSDTMNEGEAR